MDSKKFSTCYKGACEFALFEIACQGEGMHECSLSKHRNKTQCNTKSLRAMLSPITQARIPRFTIESRALVHENAENLIFNNVLFFF